MSLFMTSRRLLLLEAKHLTAYHWQNGHIVMEGIFSADDQGLEDFGQYLKKFGKSLFTLLADVAEEGFQIETIPGVRGRDRNAIIARRLGQYFYGCPYATTLSLSRETKGRKDEQLLFAALTLPHQIDPWMVVIKAMDCQLTALHSAPFLVAELHKGLGIREGRQLLLTVGRDGLRQTYFENGRLRFSRLTPFTMGSMEEVARSCVRESEKIYQYLVGQRLLDLGTQVSTLVYVLSAEQDHFRLHCQDTHNLRFEFIALEKEAERHGLKTPLSGSCCELLLLHLLIQSPSSCQFGPGEIHRPYRIWQLRLGLRAMAITGLAACLVFATRTALHTYAHQQETSQIEADIHTENGYYEAMLKTLPATPLKVEDLRTVVDRFTELETRSPPLKNSLLSISRALDDLPAVELERIDWILSDKPEDTSIREQGSAGQQPLSSQLGRATIPSPQGNYFAVMELSLKLPLAYANDHRAMLNAVDTFKDALQKTPGLSVKVLRMPFDAESGKTIKSNGDSDEVKAEAPNFSLRVVQRVY